jgi:predicted lipoprotein with Yx(FWY)xxD motif
MRKPNYLARSIAAAVGAVTLFGAGTAAATTPPTEPPADTAMTADTATADTAMTAETAVTGAGPSDCPPITEEATEGSEAPATSGATTATEAAAVSETSAATEAPSAATEAPAGTEAPTATEVTGSTVTEGSAPAVSGPFVQIVETDEYGPILVDSECVTLYGFTNDADGEPTCVDDCAATWPPLFVPDESVPPLADELDPSLFSVVQHPEGPMLKVGDWPLYYYAPDGGEPGQINGQGVGGVWWVVAPDGTLIQTEEETEGTGAPATSMPSEAAPATSMPSEAAPATTTG